MNMNDYQSKARSFATGGGLKLEYALLGLAEEAGEACGKAAKYVRKTGYPCYMIHRRYIHDDESEPVRAALGYELGDCLWMVANAAAALGYSLEDIASMNIAKLVERRNAGVICGSGDTTAERIANAAKEAK